MKKFINIILIIFAFILITNTETVYGAMSDSDCMACEAEFKGHCGIGECKECKREAGKCIAKVQTPPDTSPKTKADVLGPSVKLDCSSEGVKQTMSILGTILDWIQVVIPVIVVIVGIVGLVKAVLASDDGLIKKAVSGLITKVFIAAAVVFLPMIIFSIVNLIDSYDESAAGGFSCIRCIEKPNSSECQVSWNW